MDEHQEDEREQLCKRSIFLHEEKTIEGFELPMQLAEKSRRDKKAKVVRSVREEHTQKTDQLELPSDHYNQSSRQRQREALRIVLPLSPGDVGGRSVKHLENQSDIHSPRRQ